MKILTQNKVNRILLLFLLLSINACKTSKTGLESTGSLADLSTAEIYQSILNHSIQYRTLSGKLNISLKTPGNKIASNASIKIVKDEIILISFVPFPGYEALKCAITPDSIVVVSRYSKQYAAERISNLNGKNAPIDFNFYNLQALMTNQLFVAGKNSLSPNDRKAFTIENAQNKSTLKIKDRQSIQYLFVGNPMHRIQSLHLSTRKQDKSVTLLSEYGNFQSVSNMQIFPMLLNIKLNTSSDQDPLQKKKQEYEIKLDYSRIDVDKDIDTGFSIPQKYQRVFIEDLIEMINKLI